ncbi:hypothetical protein PsYK624_154010 [Phanerochaete sordida]|uniref:DUF7330 domain-containing protein n=1 Tax=Phanerochaete sordida TaxID=48140 RepID=A0A9P3GT82_9APHY|nr:hypothetical protein PsYK624_154010 [Phanerochaete sordida]
MTAVSRSGAADARVDVCMYYTAAHVADRTQLLREQPAASATASRSRAKQPQRVANLESDLGTFGHVPGDLADGVQFDRIALSGTTDPIQAKQGGSGVFFTVGAQTSNGDVHLRVPEAPLDAALRLHATSAIGDVTAALPRTFEGAFVHAQSFPALAVRYDARTVAWARSRMGKATWGKPRPGKVVGDVKLTTSIGNTEWRMAEGTV